MADEIERIAKKIEVLSESALSQRSSYLLSELGKDLGRPDLATLKLHTGKTLSAFIRERLSDKFTVALTGQFKNVQTLIRSPNSMGEQQEQPLLTISEKVVVETQVLSKPSPRFNYRFWAAFSVPYREGKRFLNLTDFKFQDLPSGDPPEGHVEIPPSFIVTPETRDRDKVIAENINRWIEENGFNKSDFYQTRPHKETIQTHSTASVLEAVIDSLDHRQLSSTQAGNLPNAPRCAHTRRNRERGRICGILFGILESEKERSILYLFSAPH